MNKPIHKPNHFQRTCLRQNCAPVCPHVIITPTIDQQTELYNALLFAFIKGGLSRERKDDLTNMLMHRGPYRVEE